MKSELSRCFACVIAWFSIFLLLLGPANAEERTWWIEYLQSKTVSIPFKLVYTVESKSRPNNEADSTELHEFIQEGGRYVFRSYDLNSNLLAMFAFDGNVYTAYQGGVKRVSRSKDAFETDIAANFSHCPLNILLYRILVTLERDVTLLEPSKLTELLTMKYPMKDIGSDELEIGEDHRRLRVPTNDGVFPECVIGTSGGMEYTIKHHKRMDIGLGLDFPTHCELIAKTSEKFEPKISLHRITKLDIARSGPITDVKMINDKLFSVPNSVAKYIHDLDLDAISTLKGDK